MQTVMTINGINYHYTRFFQYKKNGKKREINAPCDALKTKQNELKSLLEQAIDPILPSYVVGFRKGYDVKKNGEQHLGRKWVINLDVKDFFPSITKEILENELVVYKNLIEQNGYHFNDAIEFTILNRTLPQGSPVSPLLSNYVGYKLIDTKIYPYLLKRFGSDFGYTRYADDITISLNTLESRESINVMVNELINKVESDGLFSINKEKISIRPQGWKQVVTGVVVNGKTSLGSRRKKKYRAIIHKVKNNEIQMTDRLRGKLAYVKLVDPEYYEKLQRSLK